MKGHAALVLGLLGLAAVGAGPLSLAWLLFPVVLALAGLSPRAPQWTFTGAAVLLGTLVGLQPLFAIPHLLMFGALLVVSRRRFALVTGTLAAVVPLFVVAWVLYGNAWLEEAHRALALASGLGLGFLVGFWAHEVGLSFSRVSRAWAVVGVSALVALPFGLGPTWPAHRGLGDADNNRDRLVQFMRQRAAGEGRAGYDAAALWLEHYRADLGSLRSVCPRRGTFDGGRGARGGWDGGLQCDREPYRGERECRARIGTR